MAPAVPPMAELVAPAGWRTVDLLSDLHLDRQHPATLAAFASYLQHTQADAILLLGDLFEVWVGDDAIDEPGSFEAEACALLQRAAAQRPLYFMHGNRDFLVGAGFARATGVALLDDPTVLTLGSARWLLSHGDALCLDDVEYQRFRALARDPAWQAQLLAQPLTARRAHGKAARSESEARKSNPRAIYADVDTGAALAWLRAARAPTLIHGHTHRPADHTLPGGRTRHVLTDWDLDDAPHRAEVLRLGTDGSLKRLGLGAL
ncbi:UDP-2,3-diacylglucosamine diphosphatase [Comamonas faecalis]|uniref:UDP-2,3-diacylglucosamine hydrolase n=1 Tax=Comamonas faecalis TaxID=1387849 RepID=A0ABP7R8F4_9BURK